MLMILLRINWPVHQKIFPKFGGQNTTFDPQANFRGVIWPQTLQFPRPCTSCCKIVRCDSSIPSTILYT